MRQRTTRIHPVSKTVFVCSRMLEYCMTQFCHLLIHYRTVFTRSGRRAVISSVKLYKKLCSRYERSCFLENSTGTWTCSGKMLSMLTQLFPYHRRLVVASEYEPYSIVERLMPYLGGSASLVVHSPHLQVDIFRTLDLHQLKFGLNQPLIELQSKLRVLPQFLGPVVTEGWLRRYQVRTHRCL